MAAPFVQQDGIGVNLDRQGESRGFSEVETARRKKQSRYNRCGLLAYSGRQIQASESGCRSSQTAKLRRNFRWNDYLPERPRNNPPWPTRHRLIRTGVSATTITLETGPSDDASHLPAYPLCTAEYPFPPRRAGTRRNPPPPSPSLQSCQCARGRKARKPVPVSTHPEADLQSLAGPVT